jgi:hypothetical protein
MSDMSVRRRRASSCSRGPRHIPNGAPFGSGRDGLGRLRSRGCPAEAKRGIPGSVGKADGHNSPRVQRSFPGAMLGRRRAQPRCRSTICLLSLLLTPSASSTLKFQRARWMMAAMLTLILTGLLRGVRTRRALVLENLALRHQQAVLQRTARRPRLRPSDRVFWVLLARLWHGWAEVVAIVQPETVIRWQRTSFRLFWTWKSRRPGPGRPAVAPEFRALIRTMARANPPVGRTPDPRRAPEARPRDLAGHGLQVPGPPSNAPVADVAHVHRQSTVSRRVNRPRFWRRTGTWCRSGSRIRREPAPTIRRVLVSASPPRQ